MNAFRRTPFGQPRRLLIRRLLIRQLLLLTLLGIATAPAEAASLRAPYWYVDRTTEATLEIASNAAEERAVVPILFLEGRDRLVLDALVVPPGGTLRLSLLDALKEHLSTPGKALAARRGAWGDGSRPGSLWGSVALEGLELGELHASILVEGPSGRPSLNSMLVSPARGTDELVGAWWRPTSGTRPLFALQNLGDETITVAAELLIDGRRLAGKPFFLGPGESRLVPPEALLPTGLAVPATGAVLFTALDDEARLHGETLLLDERGGFSAVLHMHAPGRQGETRLEHPGLLLGDASDLGLPGLRFTAQLLLANLGDDPLTITWKLRPASPVRGFLEAPFGEIPARPVAFAGEVTVPAHQVLALELGPTAADGLHGLALEHSGNPEDLAVQALSIDRSRRFVFYDPLTDTAFPPRTQTSVAFTVAEGRREVISLKNTRTEPTQFNLVLHLDPDTGEAPFYRLAGTLAPGAVAAFDLTRLRDDAVTDIDGRRLPSGDMAGHVLVHSAPAGVIAGDLAFGSGGSSASCFDPCECQADPLACEPQVLSWPPDGTQAPWKLNFCADDPPVVVTWRTNFKPAGVEDGLLQRVCKYTVWCTEGCWALGSPFDVHQTVNEPCAAFWEQTKRSDNCSTIHSAGTDNPIPCS